MSPAFKAAGASVAQLGKEADAAGTKIAAAGQKASKFEGVASKIDAGGRNMRIGLAGAAQAADLLGVNLGGVIGPASGAADAIGDIVGAVSSLGLVAGAVGIAITAFALFQKAVADQRAEIEKTLTAHDEFIASMKEVAAASSEAATLLKEYTTAAAELQQAQNFASASGGKFGQAVVQAAAGADEAQSKVDKLAAAIKGLDVARQAQKDIAAMAQSEYDAAFAANAAAEANDKYADSLERSIQLLAGQVNAAASMAEATRTADGWMGRLGKSTAATGDLEARGIAITNEWNAANKRLAEDGLAKAKAAAAAAAAAFRSLVEGALQQTKVTQEDLDAAAAGKYVDKWDELARQAEAVATGTPVENFTKLGDALKETGLSAEAFAKGFRDMSLFADPKNLKFADFGPIVEDVKHQLDEMIGKANLTSAAMKEVWKNLSPQQKAALAEQGIDNASDALGALLDPAGLAEDKVKGLGSAMAAIPSIITTTFNVVKDAAELAIQEFREVLDKFIADYGSITISINAEANATAPTTPTAPEIPAGKGDLNFARGTDFIVPPGFPNDAYSFRGNLTSGERVTITPPNQGGGAWGGQMPTFIFYIDGERMRGRAVRMRAVHAQT